MLQDDGLGDHGEIWHGQKAGANTGGEGERETSKHCKNHTSNHKLALENAKTKGNSGSRQHCSLHLVSMTNIINKNVLFIP